MGTFGKRTHDALLAAPAVTDLVVGRIFPAKLPQKVVFPAIRYSVVSDVPVGTLEGATSARNARVQVDAFDRRYGDVQALADAIAGALGAITTVGFRSMLIMRRDLYEDEPEPGLHRVSMDFSMWMTEDA